MTIKQLFIKRKTWKVAAGIFSIPIALIAAILIYLQTQHEAILQSQISKLNKSYSGAITIGKSNLSLFTNFPYISLRINDIKLMENKALGAPKIMHIKAVYVGFNLRDIINKNYNIQSIILEDGAFNIVLHSDGKNNLENAFKSLEQNPENSSSFNINLKKVKLKNIAIHKIDETTNTDIETYVFNANGGFEKEDTRINAHIESAFKLNVIKARDTTYIKDKHFKFETNITYNDTQGLLSILPTNLTMEHADFELQGTVNTKQNMDLDLSIKGTKSNFNTLIAFAPHDLIPVLERYKNAGDIYFNAVVKGELQNEKMPFIDVNFGSDKAFLENTEKQRRITDLGFNGHFTNGEERTEESMEFTLNGVDASLERGEFKGSLAIKNFKHPDVKANFEADFNIKFIAEFFNINNIKNTSGNVSLKMNFHDIIDINNPELALSNLNRAYFSELKIEDLSITSDELPVPLERLNAHIVVNGKAATINQLNVLFGKSDASLTGFVSNLPAIIHHSKDSVTAHLDLTSNFIDIAELTKFSENDSVGVQEEIRNLSLGLSFKTIAKNFTEFKHLPKGEFFVDSLHAQLKHYPHELHDFHADVLIDDTDMKLVNFSGFIDDSDFSVNGLAHNYGFWFQNTLNGDVDVNVTLQSKTLKLKDIFLYNAKNYMPKEYRHETFDNLVLKLNASMHYNNSALRSVDINLGKLHTKMQLHPNTFEDFSGHFHYKDKHIVTKDFKGKIGKTNFNVDLNYYLGDNNAIKKRDNHLSLKADYIDYDALFQFNAKPKTKEVAKPNELKDVASHKDAFNLYKLPFTNMTFDVDIKHFIYHNMDLQNIKGKLRTTPNHYIYVDTLSLNGADGTFNLSGYFNGSDPERIYFKPNLKIEHVDIDKLLFKYENFGQDISISENLHGSVSSEITGNIRMYPNMVPDIDQSEIHMDVKVLNGRLENYEPMQILSSYLGNKNLKNIRFDTLSNTIDINKGKIIIPNMTIESTLGHMDISGTHDSEHNIEYYLRIPLKTAKQAALYKIFGNKQKVDSIQEDTIIKKDTTRRTRYLNLKVHGTIDDYKISLKKKQQ